MTVFRISLLLLGFMLAACGPENQSAPVQTESGSATQSAPPQTASDSATHSVSLMTLNVQNLFDNIDDPVKDDKAYLPIEAKQNEAHKRECAEIRNRYWRSECLDLDWSDDAVSHKMSVLGEVIRQVDGGRGADVIALQEVENIGILERLRNEHLADLGYQPAILIEGKDNRGIDVAFLSKLPLAAEPILHPLTIKTHRERARDTRGVLEARFTLPDGSTMTGYSVHFPAPYHPTEMRVAAYEHLQSLKDALPDDELVFAAGDFNTTSTEDEQEKLLDKMVRPDWQVVHDFCEGCKGTYYYARDDNWSFLDMILVSGETDWEINPESVAIANSVPAQVKDDGTPARYQPATREGVSDHWPLIVTLQLIEG